MRGLLSERRPPDPAPLPGAPHCLRSPHAPTDLLPTMCCRGAVAAARGGGATLGPLVTQKLSVHLLGQTFWSKTLPDVRKENTGTN